MSSVFAVRFVGFLVFAVGVRLAFHRTRPNLWSGLRIPWTLADEEVWERANRVAGYLMALYSTVFFLPIAPGTVPWLALPGAALCSAGAAAYARYLYRLKHGTISTRFVGFGRYEPKQKS